MVEGGMKVIKYAIFAFNFLFWISGIAIIAVGAVAQSKFSTYDHFLEAKFWSPPVLLIVVGCFITLIAFFGCCGAIRENHCMTMTFAVLLAIILILELSAGIAAYVLRGDLDNIVSKEMKRELTEDYGREDFKLSTKSWDGIQNDSECCGAQNFTDWEGSYFAANVSAADHKVVPKSCCINRDSLNNNIKCGQGTILNVTNIYPKGCYTVLKNAIEHNIVAVGGTGVGLAFMQLLGVVFACCLARAIRYEYETV